MNLKECNHSRSLYDDLRHLQIGMDVDKSFEHMVQHFGELVYGTAFKITSSHPESEEIFQDVFCTVYKKITTLKNLKSFSAWLYKITINSAYSKMRSCIKNNSVCDYIHITDNEHDHYKPLTEYECAMSSLLSSEQIQVIKDAVNDLPDRYKNVLVLRDLQNYSLQRTSDELTISVPAVKSRLHRARKQLKIKLDKYFSESNMVR